MSGRDWPGLLAALLAGQDLSPDDTAWAMREVMSGEATPAQVAGFAVALRAKGETPDELAGLVRVMLEHAQPVDVRGPVVDTCGTGGDRAHTVNISTMAAIVVAAAGVRVVKHGNRAASSACGSADLLEHLGVVIDLPADGVTACVEEAGIAFCFAPVFHPALRHAAVPRRELGVPTFFNFLGPLTNPARPAAQSLGVADARMAPVMAGVLAQRGTSALVFRGDDGLDELSTSAPSHVWLTRDGEVAECVLDPSKLDVQPATREDLHGGDAAHNAAITHRVFDGERGPVRDAVLLNAAAALVAHDGVTPDQLMNALPAAIGRAADAIDSGAASALLDRWTKTSQRLKSNP